MPKYNVKKILNLIDSELEVESELDTESCTTTAIYSLELLPLMPHSFNSREKAVIFCLNEQNQKITLFNCSYLFDLFNPSVFLTFNGLIIGAHIADLECLSLKEYSVYLKNDVLPKQHVVSNQTVKLSNDLMLHTDWNIRELDHITYYDGDIISIKSPKGAQYKLLKCIFCSVMELTYLCIGYFNKIDKTELTSEQHDMLLYYNANASIYSHANNYNLGHLYLSNTSDIKYGKAIPMWRRAKEVAMYGELEGAFFHYFLTAQNLSVPVEIRLSMLVQCIDGFVNKFYSKSFTAKDLNNYGHVKLRSAITFFIQYSANRQLIFQKEILNQKLDDLISDLLSTRILFSHLCNKVKILSGKTGALYFKKLLLLWRVALLEEMNIPLEVDNLIKIVALIDNSMIPDK